MELQVVVRVVVGGERDGPVKKRKGVEGMDVDD
jgi:hypothetical protein